MPTYFPEAASILTLFELVLGGVPLAVLLWVGFRERARSTAWAVFVGGFVLLCAAFIVQASYVLAISPAGDIDTTRAWIWILSDGARACSSAALGAALLMRKQPPTTLRSFLVTAVSILGLGVIGLFVDSLQRLNSITPLTALRLADVAVLALGVVRLGVSNRLPASALALLAAGRAGAVVSAAWPPLTAASWGIGISLHLAGLILLALILERESKMRLLHHVLRFNLVFVSLAACLVVVLAEIGQRQFIAFSVLQVQDVAEFARGDLIVQRRLGKAPEEILANPDVSKRLIREFGRYPDLRRIRLELEGRALEIVIDDAGEIDQQLGEGGAVKRRPVAPRDFVEAVLLREPVVIQGRVAGSVELHHSLLRINAAIGRQMQAAFGVFTLFVIVGSVATGILVLVAERTIGRQYQELAEAQRRLSLAERLASVGAVASAVAHEINNPAGVLVARSDYLLSVIRGKPNAADIQTDVDTIRRQAHRIAKTVRDLLNTADRTRLAREPVDLAAVVQSAIVLVRPVFRNRSIGFECRIAPGLTRVLGDRDRLEQVFVNLLSNGAQAIDTEGRVIVSASLRAGGEWVDLAVTDTGTGINPEDLNRIFEPFFSTKDVGVGSGLGLSIVRWIIHHHGGHIDVQSTPGAGTVFRVSLPAALAPQPGTSRPDGGTGYQPEVFHA